MDSMSEQWWEKKLNIRTAGKVDHFIEEACNPYEPTDYCILEALADSGYISSDSHVLDYGCGKGRTAIFLSFRTGCRATGIEFDQEPSSRENTRRESALCARMPENMRLRARTAFISSIHLRRRSCGPSLAKYSSPIMRIRDRCICSFIIPLRLRWRLL